MFMFALLALLLLLASYTDIRERKIYNWITYPGILLALGLNGLGELARGLGLVGENTLLETVGWIGFGQSLLGLLLCGFILLVCYVFLKVGGGDVKLLAMVGAFLGPEKGLEALLWTFVLGAGWALLVLLWSGNLLQLLLKLGRTLYWTLRLGHFTAVPDSKDRKAQSPLFLAPCALLAVFIVEFSLASYI